MAKNDRKCAERADVDRKRPGPAAESRACGPGRYHQMGAGDGPPPPVSGRLAALGIENGEKRREMRRKSRCGPKEARAAPAVEHRPAPSRHRVGTESALAAIP